MAAADVLGRIPWLYHFTDYRNLPSIKEKGGLYSRKYLTSNGFQEFITGGNQWSLDADEAAGMDEYVHLCLKRKHPLEYLATQDGRIEKTLWLFVDAASVFKVPGVLFSYGVSNKTGVKICPIEEGAPDIDLQVLQTFMDWNDAEVQARLNQAELCEILVPQHVPIQFFERFLPVG